MSIQNPIIRGFAPDPSILRVGEDYYIACSSFEWFPGVQIFHSRDLVNWDIHSRPLDETRLLNLRGVPDSGGVWAPCLSHDDELFHLVFSNVKSFQGVWKDTPNYLTTSSSIDGPWSDPIYLGSAGFDGSLFHDTDDRKWYLSMETDHREGKFFGGIIMQEYFPENKSLGGPIHKLTEGTDLGCTEGPHLYKINDYYHLILAEGGTEYLHAVTWMRSKNILGPYELHPNNPIVTAAHHPRHPLQKTGHGDIIQSSDGKWYITYLCARPLTTRGRCITGRETALEELVWRDGWPYLKNGHKLTRQEIPSDTQIKAKPTLKHYCFQDGQFPLDFQNLRIPMSIDWCEMTTEGMILYGQDSLSSLLDQSLIARRITEHRTKSSVQISCQPEHFQHMAGLVLYYNTYHWIYCFVSANDKGDSCLQVLICDKYKISELLTTPIVLPDSNDLKLEVVWKKKWAQFFYSIGDNSTKKIGPPVDASILSDDYVCDAKVRYRPAFTCAFVGMACQDLRDKKFQARFKNFTYEILP